MADGKKNNAKLMKINCLIKVTATPIGRISFAIMSLFDHCIDNIKIIIIFNSERYAFSIFRAMDFAQSLANSHCFQRPINVEISFSKLNDTDH